MKKLVLVGTLFILTSCSMMGKGHNHDFTEHKEHAHAKKCGHESIKHGDHTDYVHDGQYHQVMNNGKVAIHGTTKDGKGKLASSKHAHQHKQSCGHEKIKHGNHVDYIHDGEYHREHKGHVDLHGDDKDSN